MATAPRRVTGDVTRWKAMSHPLRREILRHLGTHDAATSTTIAQALGENTGTTSYHLRLLAGAGVIEDIPERAHGRERWWRIIPVDHREPDYDSLSDEDRAALDEWRAQQVPGELALVNRFITEMRKHGQWARASRASGYFTAEGLDALFEGYMELLHKYEFAKEDAPSDAKLMQLRMFYLPEEPAKTTGPAD
jgi:DNA-binding transcriptional ArsR family regulator